MKKQSLKGKTAVITGASSGIGKAIALTLAQEGMNVVVAARREEALNEVVQECKRFGGAAHEVVADVTKFDDLEHLKAEALRTFGNIDVWINNAGIMAVGEFDATPISIHEQVIRTDLLGPIYGTYAILPYFKQKGAGTIINTTSVGAYVPNPFATAYSASKYGLRGFNESLQSELANEKNIHLCEVNPAFINTPGNLHAANFTGKKLSLAPPTYDPFQVAATMRDLIKSPRRSVMVGGSSRAARLFHGIAPSLFGKMLSRAGRTYMRVAEPMPKTTGNAFEPVQEGTGVRGQNMKRPSFLRWYYKRKFQHLSQN